MKNITIRDAGLGDRNFADSVIRKVMTGYVEQTWKTHEERESYFALNGFAINETQIIQLDGKNIGTIVIKQEEESTAIDQIFLLPEYQNRGLGKSVMQQILNEAFAKGKHVTLCVLKVNPAKHLYDRMGFAVYKETDQRYYMRAFSSDLA